jgi:hypothetical protein
MISLVKRTNQLILLGYRISIELHILWDLAICCTNCIFHSLLFNVCYGCYLPNKKKKKKVLWKLICFEQSMSLLTLIYIFFVFFENLSCHDMLPASKTPVHCVYY